MKRLGMACLFIAIGCLSLLGQQSRIPATGLTENDPVTVSGAVTSGLIVKRGQPVYPEELKGKRVGGTVVIRALVGPDGNVRKAKFVDGPPDLTDAAVIAARQYVYRPYLYGGKPVFFNTLIMINFTPK